MSQSFNQCSFSGNLTKDAEMKSFNDREVARFGIAINGRNDDVWFLDCDYWQPGAVMQFLTRGKGVIVSGEMRQASWDKNGEIKTKMVLNVRSLTLMGGGKKADQEPTVGAVPW